MVGEVDLERAAATNPADYLNSDLPPFVPSNTAATSNTSTGRVAGNSPDLRGLGPQRTLVLVDGRRHVATNPAGRWRTARHLRAVADT